MSIIRICVAALCITVGCFMLQTSVDHHRTLVAVFSDNLTEIIDIFHERLQYESKHFIERTRGACRSFRPGDQNCGNIFRLGDDPIQNPPLRSPIDHSAYEVKGAGLGALLSNDGIIAGHTMLPPHIQQSLPSYRELVPHEAG
jgi:hypothetical protein